MLSGFTKRGKVFQGDYEGPSHVHENCHGIGLHGADIATARAGGYHLSAQEALTTH
jgi:hypothetical protein